MTDRALRRTKRELRERIGEARDALPEEVRATYGEMILARLLALPSLDEAETVSLFASFGSEVPTEPMIDRLADEGHRIALPRVEGTEIVLVAFRPGEPTSRAAYGALEPTGNDLVVPEDVDLIVTPGLAFDPAGHRVGYGGGLYDRLLRRSREDALRVALAFEVQVVDVVPYGPADELVDAVLTERRTLWAEPGRTGGRPAPPL